jgi:carboxylesterase type B
MGKPVVFVSANYRLNFFGTLSSREVTEAGIANLFLKDQDVAFEWVQKYISQFGGDPSKVTVFGESAGAMSTTTHMVLNNGDVSKKFRAAWIFSGPVPKVLDFSRRGQMFFDRLMGAIGCGDAANKLQCAKDTAYEKIYAAVQGETNFLSYTATLVPWYPRPDGEYLVDDPAKLTGEGKVANIPFVIGNMIDEGTLFSLITQLNVTTNEDIVDFFDQVYFTETPRSLIEEMVSLYSDSQADGSPYDTGLLNVIGPKYKKISSMIGDYTFTSGRRTLLNVTSDRQPTWSYQIKQTLPVLGQVDLLNPLRLNDIPVIGSFHISDVVLNAFGTIPATVSKNSLHIMSSLIQFANTLDPNVPSLNLPRWPRYNPQAPQQFQFREDGPRLIGDAYRKRQMDFLERNAAQLRA